jgi:hypothetical protein
MRRMGRPPVELDPERYAAWRSSLPWSDEAIAAVLDREGDDYEAAGSSFMARKMRRLAEAARNGRVFSITLRHALPRLVESCEICGKTAMYRYGSAGRCRQHKMDTPTFVTARRARLEAKASAWDRELESQDRLKRKDDMRRAHARALRCRPKA